MISHRHTTLMTAALVAFMAACSDQNPMAVDETAPESGELAPLYMAPENGIKDAYMVVLKDGTSTVATTSGANLNMAPAEPTAAAHAIAATVDATPRLTYDGLVSGFAAKLTPDQVQELRRNPEVAYIEQDQLARAAGRRTQYVGRDGDPWGLDRIDQRSRWLSRSYTYGREGWGVHVYLIDSGLDADHPEFESRARNVFDAFGGSGSDCTGHGTAVAGIVGGKTYGVAKKSRLYGLRVLSCNNWARYSDVIKALEWVRRNHREPAVVNISVAGSRSRLVNHYVNDFIEETGIFVVAPAGNNSRNACYYTPAGARLVFTVAATAEGDYPASYTNYGGCIDSYAPGSYIETARRGGGDTRGIGTSYAAPHVVGVAALYLQVYENASPSRVTNWIKEKATRGAIRNNLSNTPNRLLYKAWL